MLKIVAEEQGWLDIFNTNCETNFRKGDIVSGNEVINVIFNVKYLLKDEIESFNNRVAQGKAIWLEEVNEMDNMSIEEKINKWAEVRGLDKANPAAQMIKAQEELGELSAGFNKKDMEKFIDSLGDLQVVLIILAAQMGVSYKDSLISAYNEIKDRKGMMIGDSFVKYADLSDEKKAEFDAKESGLR